MMKGTPWPVGRVRWLEALCTAVFETKSPLTATDLAFAVRFTQGAFDYETGAGTRHQTATYLMARTGLSKPTVLQSLRRLREGGFLVEQPLHARAIGPGKKTPLYRLTIPAPEPPSLTTAAALNDVGGWSDEPPF